MSMQLLDHSRSAFTIAFQCLLKLGDKPFFSFTDAYAVLLGFLDLPAGDLQMQPDLFVVGGRV